MQHILIIRPGAIGDALLTFPVIQALRTRHSAPHVTFVSNPAVLPLALDAGLAEEVSDYALVLWSELFSAAGIRTSALQGLLQHIDIAICWLSDPDGIVEQNLQANGVKHITIAPGRPPADTEVHIVDYLAHTIWPDESSFLSNNDHAPIFPSYHRHFTHRIANDHSRGDARRRPAHRIAIHPGSGGAYKCWPVSGFATVITTLWQRNIPILLLAGPADSERLTNLLQRLPTPGAPELLSILQDAPLRTVAQELQQCRGYLGNDSGITHLAALLDIPTIVLFGPSNPAIWHPYGGSIKVLYKPVLANLPPDTVLYTVEEFFYLAL